MDYEKAYKDLIAKVKKAHLYAQTDSTKAVLEDILPELSESEDERIILSIVKVIKGIREAVFEYEGVKKADVLAYLEKQKEQKLHLTVTGKGFYKICPHCKSPMIRDDSKVYTSIPPKYGYNCPKCGTMEFDTTMYDSPEMEEQKPAEPSDEELQRHQDELHDFKVFATKQAKEHHIHISFVHDFEWNNFCEGLLSYFNEKQKPAEWSEDDEKMVQFWNMYYEHKVDDWPNKDVVEHLEKFKEWLNNRLKSLRPQPKMEWSEEDELTIADLINFFEGDSLECSAEEMVQRIKSLSPRPHWKPSEEQMNHLWVVVNEAKRKHNISVSGYPTARILESLYNDLKKL